MTSLLVYHNLNEAVSQCVGLGLSCLPAPWLPSEVLKQFLCYFNVDAQYIPITDISLPIIGQRRRKYEQQTAMLLP